MNIAQRTPGCISLVLRLLLHTESSCLSHFGMALSTQGSPRLGKARTKRTVNSRLGQWSPWLQQCTPFATEKRGVNLHCWCWSNCLSYTLFYLTYLVNDPTYHRQHPKHNESDKTWWKDAEVEVAFFIRAYIWRKGGDGKLAILRRYASNYCDNRNDNCYIRGKTKYHKHYVKSKYICLSKACMCMC